MSNIFKAVKEKFSSILKTGKGKFQLLKQKPLLRIVLISAFALLLIFSVTFAWYINNVGIFGIEFNTGNIDFNTYVYSENGVHLVGPVSSNEDDESKYINAPLITIEDAQLGTTSAAYIVVQSTGSIGIKYRIAFDIAGKSDKSTAYLGGYKYNVSNVTDKVIFNGNGNLDVTNCPGPETIGDDLTTIDRNTVNGIIEQKNDYEVYRVDYALIHKNEEYTGSGIKIYFNIFATQIDGDFEDQDERGQTYYCSTKEDIDRARVEAYPGDTIKLSSDIIYYGDLVFNKPINLETNDFTLTVNGNLMYDYVLGNRLKLDAGGLGKIVVQCTREGVGGNFLIKAPIGDVTLVGSNSSNGDIVVEKNIIIDATNSFGSVGASFNNIKIVDMRNSRKTIQLESNTRATVSFNTTIGLIQSVAKASNIEIVNNGVIGEINLSNMLMLEQTTSPQIYILNNNSIENPIILPGWSEKFQENAQGVCTGNTRIIQSYSGSTTEVTGSDSFVNDDVEVERKEFLVEQIEEGYDSRLKIYYQDIDGQTTSIQSILEEYLRNEASTGCNINEIVQLEIISINNKAVTYDDLVFMNSDNMLSLKYLDMQRANMYDRTSNTYDKLPAGIFRGNSKYENLILPQNLVAIGANAFYDSAIENIITIPSGVTEFGSGWFYNGRYVRFAASVPVAQAASGLANARAIFVDETYISSYKTVYSQYATRIYPVSELDETKEHFVRNIKNDEWEITYYIGGADAVIGENIAISGMNLKITSVYDHAYRHNFTGTKVKFADTVETLGAGNFYNNSKITEADLNKLKHIGDDAFLGATSLTNVSFGNSLETIGAGAFLGCNNLANAVVLPDTMQKIGASAFERTNITSVNTGGTTAIGGYAFASCLNLVNAELPNVVEAGEGASNYLFKGCNKLVSVKIPALTKADGAGMFQDCVSLREVYMAATDDTLSMSLSTYSGCDKTKIKLYVPEDCIEFYQNRQPGGISKTMIYPQGEKMGKELVNGFDIGTYIVGNNGNGTYCLITSNVDYVDRLEIPAAFDGKAITSIYANAFRNQNLTNVTLKLGNNITSIGNHAFYQRLGLVKIEFGDSLKTIGSSAFAYCSNLVQDIDLPDSMQSIRSEAFRDTGILSVQTGGTSSVDDRAFANCTSLVYAIMPDVTVIAESGVNEIFANCTSLVSVDMPKVAVGYGNRMFLSCSNLQEVYMGSDDANVSLGTIPFSGITSTQVKLFVPESLVPHYRTRGIINSNQVYPRGEKIGNKSVIGFRVGDYVVMENSIGYTLVTSNLSYEGSEEIPGEYLDKPITEIYANAFRNQTFTDANLVLGSNVKTIGNGAFYGRTGLKSVDMDQVTTIGDEAFFGSGIQILNAPKLTSIGNSAFRTCASLETVSIPMIETIENGYVFAQCTALKSVYFENVRSVHGYTFGSDKMLEKITINRQINSNGDNMPSQMNIDVDAPCKIYVPYRSLSFYPSIWSGKPVVSFDISAVYNEDIYILANKNGGYTLIDFVPGKTISALTMPAVVSASQLGEVSIDSIGDGAFSTVSDTLKSLTLSTAITRLEGAALSECAALEHIYVDANNMYFTSVNGVLYSRDAKMLVRYPAGRSGGFDMTADAYASTVGIGSYAFANAKSLTRIVFPSSLMVIDSSAFAKCTELKTVEFTGNTPPTLMGAGIFDTSVEGFRMVIPTADSNVVTAYLCAYNFGEYEPYIDLNGNEAPGATTPRNQVYLGVQPAQEVNYALPAPGKDDEENEDDVPEDETSGE